METRIALSFVFFLLFTNISQAEKILKIGVLGAMSGPAQYWGLTNKYCALATAKMYNDQGGIIIDGDTYKIEIVSYDTKLDPNEAIRGAKYLIDQNIHYIIGPNIDDTSLAIIPLLEANNVVNIAYGFSEKLYQSPRQNSFLGMIHPSQTAPEIYSYLQENHNVKSIAFLARYDKESLNQRNFGIKVATSLGLSIKELEAWDIKDVTYPSSLDGLEKLTLDYTELNPDLIVLSGVAPSDTGKLITSLRAHGYKGLLSTETAQDPESLLALGSISNGFVSLGSLTPPSLHSEYMKLFMEEYHTIAGQWHDEAGVKVYALEVMLKMLQTAGRDAIKNTHRFIKLTDSFEADDPFLTSNQILKFTGSDTFGMNKRLGVPFVINIIENDHLITKAL